MFGVLLISCRMRCVDAHGTIDCPVNCCRIKRNATNVYVCCGGDEGNLAENPIFWTVAVIG